MSLKVCINLDLLLRRSIETNERVRQKSEDVGEGLGVIREEVFKLDDTISKLNKLFETVVLIGDIDYENCTIFKANC